MKKSAKTQTLQTMKKVEPYIWLLPSIILMVVLILVPIFTVFRISFTEVGRSGKLGDFNGVANYLAIFEDPIFWKYLPPQLSR